MKTLYMMMFLWAGKKLFTEVDVYSPNKEGDDDCVVAITFSNSRPYMREVSKIELTT